MSSNNDLSFEWSLLSKQDYSKWSTADLQLAAELGKTLLERNKELEATLKHHQNIIEDRVQEIEYLTKQNAALREVNDSRMKIYEQLEVSIQDLERDKYKLALEYQAEKKHVKQLCSNIESLETKVEELTRSLEDARRQVEADRRTKKTERLLGQQQQQQPGLPSITINSPLSHASKDAIPNVPSQEDVSTSRQTTESCQSAKPISVASASKSEPQSAERDQPVRPDDGEDSPDGGTVDEHTLSEDNEEVLRIMQELERTQKSLLSEQGKVGELEEQLAVIAQENTALQSKLLNVHSNEIRSVHDELSMLEEFRQGQVCTRCLRELGDQPDESSIITGTDDDDASLMELIRNSDFPKVYRTSVDIQIEPSKPDSLDLALSECAGPNNPYRELVEKYEALLEVHRQPIVQKAAAAGANANAAAGPTAGQATAGSGNNTPVDSCQPQQLLSDAVDMLPCGTALGTGETGDAAGERGERGEHRAECSETASSGYSDEVSNKATQTDESPRNFLCTIADGKDWRFNIYEDDSAIDSRFRFSPAHRELFREIFSVLRKAAENRDEGDQLPLLDDTKPPGVGGAVPVAKGATVPPVTPANEEPPTGFGEQEQQQQQEEEDDEDGETVSFVSSSAVSEQSFAMSECITKSERRRIARQAKAASRYAEEDAKPLDGGQEVGQQQQQQAKVQVAGAAGGPPLDYISVTVGVRKGKSRRRSHRRGDPNAPAGAPTTPTPPRSGSARKHRPSFRPWNPERDGAPGPLAGPEQAGTMTSGAYGRGKCQPGPVAPPSTAYPAGSAGPSANITPVGANQLPSRASRRAAGEKKRNASSGLRNRYADLMNDALGDEVVEFRPSTASQHLHKLQKLDLSYAEVLRRADGGNPFPARRQQYNQQQQQ